MIIATSLRTESGDDYLFLFRDITNPTEYIHAIENRMREELKHVYKCDVSTLDCKLEKQVGYASALQDRIDELRSY